MGALTGRVIWQRRYDEVAATRRMQRFWMLYALPSAVLVVLMGLLSSVGAAAGVLILLGLIGGLLFVWIWLTGRNERANATVTLDGNDLCWAKRRVPIDQVTRFSAYMTSASMNVARSSTSTGVTASASLGQVTFLLVDGSDIDFAWAGLDAAQLGELRNALEDVLPGRLTPIETLRAANWESAE